MVLRLESLSFGVKNIGGRYHQGAHHLGNAYPLLSSSKSSWVGVTNACRGSTFGCLIAMEHQQERVPWYISG